MKKLITFNCRVSDSTVDFGGYEIPTDYVNFEIADVDKLWAVNWAICFYADNIVRIGDKTLNYTASKDYEDFCPAFMKPAMKALGREFDYNEKVPVTVHVCWSQDEFWIDINLKH